MRSREKNVPVRIIRKDDNLKERSMKVRKNGGKRK